MERLYRIGLKESKPEDDENMDASLPMLQEGQIFETVSASVREGKTSPPKHYTDVLCCQCGAWKAPQKKGAG